MMYLIEICIVISKVDWQIGLNYLWIETWNVKFEQHVWEQGSNDGLNCLGFDDIWIACQGDRIQMCEWAWYGMPDTALLMA